MELLDVIKQSGIPQNFLLDAIFSYNLALLKQSRSSFLETCYLFHKLLAGLLAV
jgi:hypothetical protein